TANIKKAVRRRLKEGRQLEIYDTNMIHDRYIIKDNTEGRMIGTSIGGFGAKVFTVLPLPYEDTIKLLSILYLITHDAQQSPKSYCARSPTTPAAAAWGRPAGSAPGVPARA